MRDSRVCVAVGIASFLRSTDSVTLRLVTSNFLCFSKGTAAQSRTSSEHLPSPDTAPCTAASSSMFRPRFFKDAFAGLLPVSMSCRERVRRGDGGIWTSLIEDNDPTELVGGGRGLSEPSERDDSCGSAAAGMCVGEENLPEIHESIVRSISPVFQLHP